MVGGTAAVVCKFNIGGLKVLPVSDYTVPL